MRDFRPFAFLALAITLALTSITAAMAHGQVRVGTAVTICTGTGPQTITLDANGDPAGPPHICPDCTLALVLGYVSAPPFPARPVTRGERIVRPEVHLRHSRPLELPRARGPPDLT